jgi:hypothetical protein
MKERSSKAASEESDGDEQSKEIEDPKLAMSREPIADAARFHATWIALLVFSSQGASVQDLLALESWLLRLTTCLSVRKQNIS